MVDETGHRLTSSSRSAEAAQLCNPLSMAEGVPYLPIGRQTFTGETLRLVQNLHDAARGIPAPVDLPAACKICFSECKSARQTGTNMLAVPQSTTCHQKISWLVCRPADAGERSAADAAVGRAGRDGGGCPAGSVLPVEQPVPAGHRGAVPVRAPHAHAPHPAFLQQRRRSQRSRGSTVRASGLCENLGLPPSAQLCCGMQWIRR